MKKQLLFTCALLGLLALYASGDPQRLDAKLGLWETTMNNQMSGAPPIPDSVLARLTPEQRAKMEEAMKARGMGGSQPRVYKNCVTRESLDRALNLASSGRPGCKNTLVSSSPRKQEIKMECTQGEVKIAGQVQIEALDPEHIKGEGHVKSTSGERAMDMNISFNSKWVGADCGSIQPN